MDDIHARRPVNKTSAVIISKGINYTPNKIILTADSDLPLEIRPFNSSHLKNKTFTDLRFKQFGRFIVIGLSKQYKGKWVVRCQCGIYSTRTAKSIQNPNNKSDMCESCRHLEYLKSNEKYRRQITGANKHG